jgi:hypothetical protein
MKGYYANITLQGPQQADVTAFLNERGQVAYVAPTVKSCTVVFHEDLGAQEDLAAGLSAHFQCPALLVMDYGGTVLLYHLYLNGEQADAYVSSPHDDLDTDGQPMPEGNAEALCGAFGVEHRVTSVERILRRPTKPEGDYAQAVNRHGELARSLGLPQFAAGTGYRDIEVGELPSGQGFDVSKLVKAGE